MLAQAGLSDRQLVGPGGLLTELTQRVLERALDTEMTDHLGYEAGDKAGVGWGNSRNGRTSKTVLTDVGPVEIDYPVVWIGVDFDGAKNVLGRWIGKDGEGAKYWMNILAELKNRGVTDVCFLCCDGLSGLPEAITTVWPATIVQTCIVHLIRASVRYSSKKHITAVTAACARSTKHPPLMPPRQRWMPWPTAKSAVLI